MNRALRIVFALWVALTLVIAPLGVARASLCSPDGTAASMSGRHHHDADTGDSITGPVHAKPGVDISPAHCGTGHACCSSICFGPMMPVIGSYASVVMTERAVLHLPESPLPDGIAFAPPLGPPRTTI